MKTNIENKNGNISAYGFACGYVQTFETDNLHKIMYKEHGVYHVKSLKNNTPELNTKFLGNTSHKYVIWMTYDKLADAKNLYTKIK